MTNCDPNPRALEIKAVAYDDDQPSLVWSTVMVDAIETVASGILPNTVALHMRSGNVILAAHTYEQIAEALLGDARRFRESADGEQAILNAAVQPAEEPPPLPTLGDMDDYMDDDLSEEETQ